DERDVSAESTDEIKTAGQEVPVGDTSSAANRPFPGSSTAGLSRRERRITVSDFQPSTPTQENKSDAMDVPADDKEIENIQSNMPIPTMAPSTRVVKKKRGFFKRLFGIK
ncbi:MAG: hypothetical protein GY845_16775, partial [Planctomycetes bacterium]|nr:hypothetical protein [Planctomycetota bacterium]